MDPPKVKKVMVVFELQRGCIVIATIGMIIACAVIVMIIFYSLIELILVQLQNYNSADSVKKTILVILLVNAIMLIIANGYLLVGSFLNKSEAYELSAYLLLLMLIVDILIVVGGPTACFFAVNACTVIKNSSYIVQFVILLGMMIHMDLWAYYMSCIFAASRQRRQL